MLDFLLQYFKFHQLLFLSSTICDFICIDLSSTEKKLTWLFHYFESILRLWKTKKRDPPAIQKNCIVTLTSIFLLTHDHQSLVREITTPSLPGFITSSLNIAKSDTEGALVETVLQALIELLPHHPTSIRPFVGQIRSLILPLIASTPSSVPRRSYDSNQEKPTTTSKLLAQSSQRLLVLLGVCAPKNTASEEWARSLQAVIEATHITADLVFRAVSEDWESSLTRPWAAIDHDSHTGILSDQNGGPLNLPGWTGIPAGVERLDGLLTTLQAFAATPTSTAVALPVGALLGVVNRMFSILPPSKGRNPRTNPEISREEREGLWVGLPRIHASAMALTSLLISRLGHALAPANHLVLEEVLWVLKNEHTNSDVRRTTYEVASQILALFGPSLPKALSKPLSVCTKFCCEDLLPSPLQNTSKAPSSAATSKKPSQNGSSTINADSYLKSPSNPPSTSRPPTTLRTAASALLPLLLTHLPPNFLSFPLRSQIDRTAILTQNKAAMVASVLNPPIKRNGGKEASSIMPVLARSFPECMEVEALIRPRMPVLQRRPGEEGESESDEEGELEVEVPDTYADRKDENAVTGNAQTSEASMRDSFMADTHPPLQPQSQLSQPMSLEIPETQSPIANSKKRDLDSTTESQTSTKPSNNTMSEPAPVSAVTSFEKQADAFTISNKRLRLDQPTTTMDLTTTIPPQSTTTIISDTQAAQPAPVYPLLPTQSPAQTPAQIATPSLPPAAQKEINGEGDSSDSNFEIPTIDPTIDTDEDESEADEQAKVSI